MNIMSMIMKSKKNIKTMKKIYFIHKTKIKTKFWIKVGVNSKNNLSKFNNNYNIVMHKIKIRQIAIKFKILAIISL